MKYIRTKNGIFEVLSEYDTPENTTLISNPVRAFDVRVTPRTNPSASIRIVYSNEVVNQADTIEELCDGFMLESAKGFPVDYKKFRSAKKAKERITLETTLYGFIHVRHKGLIYVAKLNENGVLELI
jgi:hypothetical protein